MPWEVNDVLEQDAALIERMSNLTPATKKIAELARESITDNFRGEWDGTSSWQPLADSTVKDREAKGYGGEHPILQRTEELMSTIDIVADGDGVDITPHAEHAIFQQEGTERIPARPFIAFSDRDEDRMLEFLDEHISGGSR